jgi:hypothetical protein
MKSKFTYIILASFFLSGLIIWNCAKPDKTKTLKSKPEFYFKMKSVDRGRFLVKQLGCNDCRLFTIERECSGEQMVDG